MRKVCNNGVEKFYCDYCGNLIYEQIPHGVNDDVSDHFGVPVKEYIYKEHIHNYITSLGRIFCSDGCEKENRKKVKQNH